MGIATGLSAGLGLVGGISQMISGSKEKRNAQDALDKYHRQTLSNVSNGLQVSTLGSDLQSEAQSQLASGEISALQDSGSRGIIGGLGKVEAGNQKLNRQIGADLDSQQQGIDQIRANDDARIRAMKNDIENRDIAGLSSQYQSGKSDMNMGYSNGIQSVGMLGGAFGRMNGGQPNDGSKFSTSGYAPDTTSPTLQNPISNRFNYDVNNTQQQPVNTYGNFFSKNPYAPSQNMGYPSWYNNLSSSLSNQKIY